MFGDELQNPFGNLDKDFGPDFSIQILGNKRIVVSNIFGVVSTSKDQMQLKMKKHLYLNIVGHDLSIEEMQQNMICVFGQICSVTFEEPK